MLSSSLLERVCFEKLQKIVPGQLLVWEIRTLLDDDGNNLDDTLKSVWNPSDPSEVPYASNQLLVRNYFFCASYSKLALNILSENKEWSWLLYKFVKMDKFRENFCSGIEIKKIYAAPPEIISCHYLIHEEKRKKSADVRKIPPNWIKVKSTTPGLMFVVEIFISDDLFKKFLNWIFI